MTTMPDHPRRIGLSPFLSTSARCGRQLRLRVQGHVRTSSLAVVVVSVFVDLRRGQGAMAMGGRMGAVLLVVLAFLLVQCVVRTEAGYESTGSMVEFTSPSGLSDEDLSAWADPGDEFLDEPTRRMLAVRRRSYISYGALNGNRAPCPSRSGRSYYTPNCNRRGGRAQPYRRGCYQITRCARG